LRFWGEETRTTSAQKLWCYNPETKKLHIITPALVEKVGETVLSEAEDSVQVGTDYNKCDFCWATTRKMAMKKMSLEYGKKDEANRN
jgi:hypothetical protein